MSLIAPGTWEQFALTSNSAISVASFVMELFHFGFPNPEISIRAFHNAIYPKMLRVSISKTSCMQIPCVKIVRLTSDPLKLQEL